MNTNKINAKELALSFYQTYYHKQFDELLNMLDENAIWSGFHNEEASIGKQQIDALLKHLEKEQENIHGVMQDIQMKAVQIEHDLCIVDTRYMLHITLQNNEQTSSPFFSTMLLRKKGQWKIQYVFFSVLGEQSLDSCNFYSSLQTMGLQEMRMTLIEHTKQMEEMNLDINTFNNTVPGGIFKCLFDENLTLKYMSDGFLNMIGYTREEVQTQLQSSLRKLIVPKDLEETLVIVEEQLKISSIKEIQYRLIHKDGHYINVLDKGQLIRDKEGNDCFHCIVVDITREKEVEEELRLTLERYQIIMNQTDDIIFEWDVIKDSLVVSNNWEKRYNARNWIESQGLVSILRDDRSSFHPDDSIELLGCIEEMDKGISYIEREVRIKNKQDVYVWNRIRMTAQFDDQHTPIKVIGVMIDIDQEKKHSLKLRKKAEQDALTGLYNKVISQNLICDILKIEPYSMHAFLIIDIDDFKKVNDTMGHLYGDAVLSELSQALQNSFSKEDDIIGRIGGDEFIVFMRHVSCRSDVEKKVISMVQHIENLRASKGKDCIACSIGISIYPKDGNDFTSLYQNADYALYQAKVHGKHQYGFYDENKMHNYLMKQNQPYLSTVNEIIDSDASTSSMEGTFEKYVFEILYHSENIEHAVSTILEIIGMRFDVSRMYVFENSDDDSYCTNTFEWCNDGVHPQIDELQHVTYEELGGTYLENFNEDRIFYCADISMLPKEQYDILYPQGIKSMLQCAITDNGKFKGYVGFDECRKNRYWTKEQIEMLVFIAEIISTFLLKRKADEKMRLQKDSLLATLDSQSSFLYVIEPDTKKLLFLNKATKMVAPEATVGMCCFKAFMNRDEACVGCPAQTLNKEHPNNRIEFYNEALDIYSDVDAAYISWENKDAILLSCHDITKYKK